MIPISASGIYDIDIDDYHSQRCCVGISVSSGTLRKLLAECPARVWAYSDLNPNRLTKDSEAFAFGRAAHALVLGEPEFNSKFIISPYDDFRKKEAQMWRDEQTKQVLKAEQMQVIQEMAAAQRSSKDAMNAFTDGEPEKSIICKDARTGFWLKVRPDWYPNDPAKRLVTEYKSAVTAAPTKLSFDAFKYGYEVQAALMLDVVKEVTQQQPLGIAHVVQEKDPPYLVELKMFTADQLAYGRKLYRKALNILHHCITNNDWPGYSSGATFYDTPYSVQKAMENFNDDGYTSAPSGTYEPADYLAAF